MKMTERIGPHRSGRNHRGHRYTPKPVIYRGMPSFSGGNVPLSQAEIAEMVQAFRRKYSRDPIVLHHEGLGTAGTELLVPIPGQASVWLKLQAGTETFLE